MNIYSKMISKTFAKCTSGKSISFQGLGTDISYTLFFKDVNSLNDITELNPATVQNGIVDLSSLSYTDTYNTGAFVESADATNITVSTTKASAYARVISSGITVDPGVEYTVEFVMSNITDPATRLFFSVRDSSSALASTQFYTTGEVSHLTFTSTKTSVILWIYCTSGTAMIGTASLLNFRIYESAYTPVWNAVSAGNLISWPDTAIDISAAFTSAGVPFASTTLTAVSDFDLNYGDQVFNDLSSSKFLIAKDGVTAANFKPIQSMLGGYGSYLTLSDSLDHFSILAENGTGFADILNVYGTYGNVHPKLLYFKNGWQGYKWWCAYTPYPGESLENPSIAVSNDLVTWAVPPGLTNPLAEEPATGWNSDTHLVYREDTDTLECWWRNGGIGAPLINRRTTTDGTNWTAMSTAYTGIDSMDFTSPCVIFEDGLYKMFGVTGKTDVNTGVMDLYFLYRTSPDCITWTASTSFRVPFSDGILPWHFDIIRTSLGLELLVQAFPPDSAHDEAKLYHSILKPDFTCTSPTIVLSPNSADEYAYDYEGFYRSSFVKIDNNYTILYTGLNYDNSKTFGKRYTLMLTTGKLAVDGVEV